MKKTYIIPATELMQFTGKASILSGSDLHDVDGILTGTVYDTEATGAGLSKGYNVWNDDWSAAE